MTDVFNRLQQAIDLKRHEEGITPLDIAELPSNMRKILKLILREVELSYAEIQNAVHEMDESDRLTDDELSHVLKLLTRQMWVIRRGEGDHTRYEVNLRRKSGRQAGGIWGLLDDRLEKINSERE